MDDVMTKCLSGCGQGHVTHLYILEPGHIFGLDVARHFKFGLQIECKAYCHDPC